jgi:hypothetical protein
VNRRQFVSAATVGGVGALAGCLSDLIDDVTTFSASPAAVTESAVDDAGYVYQGTEETVESEQVAGQDIEVTNYISEYTRTIEMPFGILDDGIEAGVFAVITTPQVSVAGEDFNPVGDMSNEEIVQYVQEQYDELSIEGAIGGRAVDALDGTVSLEEYEAEATLHGEYGLDVFFDIAQFDYGGDHFVIVGVYPDVEDLPLESERERIDTMVGGLEHGDDITGESVEDEADE